MVGATVVPIATDIADFTDPLDTTGTTMVDIAASGCGAAGVGAAGWCASATAGNARTS